MLYSAFGGRVDEWVVDDNVCKITEKIRELESDARVYSCWIGLVLWHINHCRLFNAKSSLYTYIK